MTPTPNTQCEHDFENAKRISRGYWICPKCKTDISLEYVFWAKAAHPEWATPKTQMSEWETEFDKIFIPNYGITIKCKDGTYESPECSFVKDFIRKLLTHQKEALLGELGSERRRFYQMGYDEGHKDCVTHKEELVKRVEGMKKFVPLDENPAEYIHYPEADYNSALDAVLSIINKEV